jgi:thiol-disulfide isomerase/thioredoxin
MKHLLFVLSATFLLLGCRALRLTNSDRQSLDFQKFALEKKLVAVVFLAADCPISQKYVRTLNGLAERFPQVAFVGVFTRWDDAAAMRQFQSEFQPRFLLWRDAEGRLVRRLGANVTPEVFFLKENKVLYRGAVDNWFVALGRYRPAPTEHYLEDAIRAVLEGRAVAVTRTEAVGCGIER